MPEPAVFGEYAIESVIGEGGMGKVYRARQTNLDRCVALKVFPKEFYCQDCHFTWTNEPEHPRYRFWNRFFSGPESEG